MTIEKLINEKKNNRSLALSSKRNLLEQEVILDNQIEFLLSFLFGVNTNNTNRSILDIISLYYKLLYYFIGLEDSLNIGNNKISPYIHDSNFIQDGNSVNYKTFRERLHDHFLRVAEDRSTTDIGYFQSISDLVLRIENNSNVTTFLTDDRTYTYTSYTSTNYTSLMNTIKASTQGGSTNLLTGSTITKLSLLEKACLELYRECFVFSNAYIKSVHNKDVIVSKLNNLNTLLNSMSTDITTLYTTLSNIGSNNKLSNPNISSNEITTEITRLSSLSTSLTSYRNKVINARTFFNTVLQLRLAMLTFQSTITESNIQDKFFILPTGRRNENVNRLRDTYIVFRNNTRYSLFYHTYEITLNVSGASGLRSLASSVDVLLGTNNFYFTFMTSDPPNSPVTNILYFTYTGSGVGTDTSINNAPDSTILSGKTPIIINLDGTSLDSAVVQVSTALNNHSNFVSFTNGNKVLFRFHKVGTITPQNILGFNLPSGVSITNYLQTLTLPNAIVLGRDVDLIEVPFNVGSITSSSVLASHTITYLSNIGIPVMSFSNDASALIYTHPYNDNRAIVDGTSPHGLGSNLSITNNFVMDEGANTINNFLTSTTHASSLLKLKFDLVGNDTQGLLQTTSFTRTQSALLLSFIEHGLPTTTSPLTKIKKWYVFWLEQLLSKLSGEYFKKVGMRLGLNNSIEMIRNANKVLDSLLSNSITNERFILPMILSAFIETSQIDTTDNTRDGSIKIIWQQDIGANKYRVIRRKYNSSLIASQIDNADWSVDSNTVFFDISTNTEYADNFIGFTEGDIYLYRIQAFDTTDSNLSIIRIDTDRNIDTFSLQSKVFNETGISFLSYDTTGSVVMTSSSHGLLSNQFVLVKDSSNVSIGIYSIQSVDGSTVLLDATFSSANSTGGTLHLVHGTVKII